MVVVTRHAARLSSLIYEMKKRLNPWIDSANKYLFYSRLGEAANYCLTRYGDDEKRLFDAVLAEATVLSDRMDAFLYFAYGSNMDREQMASRCPGAELLDTCCVPDMRFVLDSSGVATVVPVPGRHVYGAVWRVTRSHIKSLDRYEGVALNCYRKDCIRVTVQGKDSSALVYISQRDTSRAGHRTYYMERILAAARELGFDEEYIQELSQWCRP